MHIRDPIHVEIFRHLNQTLLLDRCQEVSEQSCI